MRVLCIYTLYDHIFPYIIGLLSYIRVIIQYIVRNHQHSSPARSTQNPLHLQPCTTRQARRTDTACALRAAPGPPSAPPPPRRAPMDREGSGAVGRFCPPPASPAAPPPANFPSGKTSSPDRPRRAVRSPIAITPPDHLGLTAPALVGRPDGHERVVPVLAVHAHRDARSGSAAAQLFLTPLATKAP